jgi:hypothetical protein
MNSTDDVWYLRFPDGQVHKMATTAKVRHYLALGRIPLGSMVRRSREDEWVAMEWSAEFSGAFQEHLAGDTRVRSAADRPELAGARNHADEPATVGSRLDPAQMQTLGVQQLINELLAALDSLWIRKKLLVVTLSGLIIGFVFALFRLTYIELETLGSGTGWALAGGALLLVGAACIGLLTQLTYVELSQLRPAKWSEGFIRMGRLTVRVALVQVLVVGLLVGLGVLLHWLARSQPAARGTLLGWTDIAAVASLLGALLAEVALVPLFCLSLLLAAILVVENCSIWKALRQWRELVARDRGRILLYEALAFSIGALVTVPFIVPLLVVGIVPVDPRLSLVVVFLRDLLFGLALTLLLGYLTIANLFIYLNVRYGVFGRGQR